MIHLIEIALGIWIMAAPWILGYAGSSAALWNSVVAGAIVAVLGLWGVFGRERADGNQSEGVSDR